MKVIVLKKTIALPLVAVALVGMLAFTAFVRFTPATGQPAGTYPADHIIRITALLEFDGKPVVVDELVTCLAEGAGGSTSGRQFLSFQPNRILVATDTPDGSMIVFQTTRSFCYTYGKTWSDSEEELTVPVGWTPVLRWYNKRDPREMTEGLWYVSETALNAENSRLKIIENFAITIPKHPFSDALLAEAETQAIERDYCLGQSVDCITLSPYQNMIAIPEDMWLNPDPKYLRDSVHASRDTDPQPLIYYLNGLGEGEGVLAIPHNDNATDPGLIVPEEALRMVAGLSYGRRRDSLLTELGIPKIDADRFGLLMSETAVQRFERRPLDLNHYDDSIPWKCEDGFLVPDFENPGLWYAYSRSAGCIHTEVFNGLMWPDQGTVENWERFYGELFFDFETKTLWRSRSR